MEAPVSQRIVRVEKLYDAGDYKEARALAKALLADGEIAAADKKRIDRVLKATGMDSVAVMAIVFTFCLLLFLVLKYGF